MTENTVSENESREQRILDAALELILHHGYDKTTMSDIAKASGIGRGVLYLHFASKDAVFEGLLLRELEVYSRVWLDFIDADPNGGTLGAVYRAVLLALNASPFMGLILKQDPRIFGQYLRKPNNLFRTKANAGLRGEFVAMLQDAGVIRRDVDAAVVAYIMDIISSGIVAVADFRPEAARPAFDSVVEAIADMLDVYLTPPDGGNPEAGKLIVRQIVTLARTRIEKELSQ